jgi:putative intracellular protease/amidase
MTANTVHLAVYDTLSDWEVGLASAHINNGRWQREPGRWRILTVSATGEPVTTIGGLRVLPDLSLAELRPQDSAMLILPGADTWMDGSNDAFVTKARELLDAGVPVAAICGATFGLAAAGLLDERRHTSDAPEFLAASGYGGGALYRDALAVTDGNVVTAGNTASVEFAHEILALLDLYEPAALASWYKLYGQHDPAGYFELESWAT